MKQSFPSLSLCFCDKIDITTICVMPVVTNCVDRLFLQNAAIILQKARFNTKCRKLCYKMRRLLQNISLLQNALEQNDLLKRHRVQISVTIGR